ncbi:MAG: copper chaperone PCu(A)C [Porphyrobacter sp.]|nr:copper chaperone PCu(A)C [Porphyrobacter sp.]
MKAALLAGLALAFATLGLGACGSRQAPAAKQENPLPAGISVADGRLVLPAVKGNPGAVYFTVHDNADSPVTLTTVHVDGAQEAMMHQTVMANGQASMEMIMQAEVPARGELAFAPGGRHVMAMNLDASLKPGGTTQVTLTFAGGNKVTFPAQILAASDAR